MASKFIGVQFEVFGRVQGVFFRKYTEKQAIKLNLFGWVANTRQGTVKGEIQGIRENIQQMKHWLEEVGSPASAIDKVDFSEGKQMNERSYHEFSIRKTMS